MTAGLPMTISFASHNDYPGTTGLIHAHDILASGWEHGVMRGLAE